MPGLKQRIEKLTEWGRPEILINKSDVFTALNKTIAEIKKHLWEQSPYMTIRAKRENELLRGVLKALDSEVK